MCEFVTEAEYQIKHFAANEDLNSANGSRSCKWYNK